MKRLLFLTGIFFANSIMVNAQNEKSDNGLYTFDKQIPSYVELTDRGASSQDQAVLETQNSGCLSRTRGYMDEWIPAIVLKKEGSILSVEVQNYISNCGTSDFVVNETNFQMLGNGTSWTYTMFSPSLYQFYEEQSGLTHLASKEVEYRVYDVQESDGRTNYLVKEELLLPGTRGINNTRAYQGNYLALREEGGRVMAGYDDYRSFLESSDQIVKAGDPSYIPYPITEKGELILYDFTLQEGDKYAAEVDGHPEIIVEKVDSFIDEVGKARRQLTLSNGCIIIEGIGCINSRGMLLSYLNPGEPIDDYIFWLSFNDDGNELVYHNEVDVSTLGIADCSVPSPNGADGTVYTIGGVRLKSPSKGINIIRQNDGTVKKRIILE